MSNLQSLKSSQVARTDVGRSITLYSASRSLGEALMCPASAQELQNDIYGRPASQQTLPVNLDASCAQGTMYPAERQIAVENQNRPYIPICAAGMRGSSDLMSKGRNLMEQDLYGFGRQADFVRHYPTANNAPWDFPPPRKPNYHYRMEQPNTLSHDSNRSSYFHN
jgi:hypothetical protein